MENCGNISKLVDSGNKKISDSERSDLKYVIEGICFAIQSAEVNNKLKCRRLSIDECISSLILIKYCIDDIKRIITLITEHPNIVHELVDAMSIILKVGIKRELRNSSYASIILNEHSLDVSKSQISISLRYAMNGEVRERFTGFVNSVGFRVTPTKLFKMVCCLKEEYRLGGTVLALACDGGVLPSQQLLEFCSSGFECRYFLPCYFQELGRIIIQSLNHLWDCHLFFKTISVIESYFEDKKNYQKLEHIFMYESLQFKKKKWDFTEPFLVFLYTYRQNFVDFFLFEYKYSKQLPGPNKLKILNFIAFLQNVKTIFLLKIFTSIFTNYLDKRMNFVNIFETYYYRENLKFQKKIEKLVSDGYAQFWIEAYMEKTGEKCLKKMKAKVMNDPDKKEYSILFEKILEAVENVLKVQTKDVHRIQFCHLLNVNSFGVQVENVTFIPQLERELSPCFLGDMVQEELELLQKDTICTFKNITVYDIIEFFNKEKLSSYFSQLYRLGEFIMAMPCLPPLKGNYEKTKLKEIIPFCYAPPGTGNPSGEISVLSVEKSMLKQVQCLGNFYDDVIEEYLSKKEIKSSKLSKKEIKSSKSSSHRNNRYKQGHSS